MQGVGNPQQRGAQGAGQQYVTASAGPDFTEKNSGLSIRNGCYKEAHLAKLLAGRKLLSFTELSKAVSPADVDPKNLQKDTLVLGVLVRKSEMKEDSKGRRYAVWNLNNLKGHVSGEATSLRVLLQDEAFEKWGNEETGTVWLLLNVRLLPKRAGGDVKGDDIPCVCVGTEAAVAKLGEAADLVFCKARKNNGQFCDEPLNKSTSSGYCKYHLTYANKAVAARRQNNNKFSTFQGPGIPKPSGQVSTRNWAKPQTQAQTGATAKAAPAGGGSAQTQDPSASSSRAAAAAANPAQGPPKQMAAGGSRPLPASGSSAGANARRRDARLRLEQNDRTAILRDLEAAKERDDWKLVAQLAAKLDRLPAGKPPQSQQQQQQQQMVKVTRRDGVDKDKEKGRPPTAPPPVSQKDLSSSSSSSRQLTAKEREKENRSATQRERERQLQTVSGSQGGSAKRKMETGATGKGGANGSSFPNPRDDKRRKLGLAPKERDPNPPEESAKEPPKPLQQKQQPQQPSRPPQVEQRRQPGAKPTDKGTSQSSSSSSSGAAGGGVQKASSSSFSKMPRKNLSAQEEEEDDDLGLELIYNGDGESSPGSSRGPDPPPLVSFPSSRPEEGAAQPPQLQRAASGGMPKEKKRRVEEEDEARDARHVNRPRFAAIDPNATAKGQAPVLGPHADPYTQMMLEGLPEGVGASAEMRPRVIENTVQRKPPMKENIVQRMKRENDLPPDQRPAGARTAPIERAWLALADPSSKPPAPQTEAVQAPSRLPLAPQQQPNALPPAPSATGQSAVGARENNPRPSPTQTFPPPVVSGGPAGSRQNMTLEEWEQFCEIGTYADKKRQREQANLSNTTGRHGGKQQRSAAEKAEWAAALASAAAAVKSAMKENEARGDNEIERQEKEKRLDALEKSERLEEEKAAVTSIQIWAFRCHQCETWRDFMDPLCVSNGHPLEKMKARKDAFKCCNRSCNERNDAINGQKMHARCIKCGGVDFEKCSIYKKLKGEAKMIWDEHKDAARGEEWAFSLRNLNTHVHPGGSSFDSSD
uniref:Protein MCM10 homolog n=1 Tax=Chromera velia CCMP2878 TaxID=1169474 RepID=A0A0G4ICL5_9ALVE|eukprot:Cvel_2258.t1-p1 / transcript=Cvel_2258.t1 / gene=Cvel_2258 / organism=Chromera_velia_CCMP2878 / gene_product=Protein MCM10 homolog, putative / transcript_product=Protein MCM10 homolog, putative / location=Cvel_scaffold87:70084-78914(-) / protein_length=1039 / sequence_SO=supercontig / SO=protein_coding / is_pseudo=false